MSSLFRVACLALVASLALGSPSDGSTEETAIEDVITRAYVEAIHRSPDRAAIEAGFHPDFVMHVLSEGQLIQVPLEMWLGRMTFDGTPREEIVEAVFVAIDVTGDTATAKVEISKDAEHIYTDYFGLYRFPEGGWKIVNKIFQGH